MGGIESEYEIPFFRLGKSVIRGFPGFFHFDWFRIERAAASKSAGPAYFSEVGKVYPAAQEKDFTVALRPAKLTLTEGLGLEGCLYAKKC